MISDAAILHNFQKKWDFLYLDLRLWSLGRVGALGLKLPGCGKYLSFFCLEAIWRVCCACFKVRGVAMWVFEGVPQVQQEMEAHESKRGRLSDRNCEGSSRQSVPQACK